MSGSSRWWWAAIAFMGHAPGIKLFTPCRLTPALVRANVIAVVLTLAAMACAFAAADQGWWTFVAWLLGHFAWSTIFSVWIVLGGAVRPDGSLP